MDGARFAVRMLLAASCVLAVGCHGGVGVGGGGGAGEIAGVWDEISPSAPEMLATVEESGQQVYVNEALAYFTEGVSEADARAVIASVQGEVVGHIRAVDLYQIRFPDVTTVAQLEAKLDELAAKPEIALATMNGAPHKDGGLEIFTCKTTPDDNQASFEDWAADPPRDENWGLRFANFPDAWDTARGDPNLKVAVVDFGFEEGHEDLRDNCAGWSSVRSDPSGSDHGTHVAGILGARGDNGRGICGAAWQCSMRLYMVAKWVPGRQQWLASDVAIAAAFLNAAETGCRVLNYSGGWTTTDPNYWELERVRELYRPVIQQMGMQGTLLVTAAGNGACTPPHSLHPSRTACRAILLERTWRTDAQLDRGCQRPEEW